MTCPLCLSSKSISLRSYRVKDLQKQWSDGYGIAPFPVHAEGTSFVKRKCANCELVYFDPPHFGDGFLYSQLSKFPWYYEKDKWEYDQALQLLARHEVGKVVELGCGAGFFLEKVRDLGVQAVGLDINPTALAECRRKGLTVQGGGVSDLVEEFDAFVSFQVLEHLDNPRQLFDQVCRVLLRPGGLVVLAVPNPDGYLAQIETNLLDLPPHHNSSWSRAAFERLAISYGLEMIDYRQEPLRYVHYVGLLLNTVRSAADLMPGSIAARLFVRVQTLVVRMLAPLSYLRDRESVVGQTHFVAFRKR